MNPIYKGDFSDDFRLVDSPELNLDLESNRLTVLAIPYCPFCEEAIEELKTIRSRVGNDVEIDFIVCTTNIEDLDYYKKKAGKGINVKIVKDLKSMINLANSKFPAYVFAENDAKLKVWSNDQFGPIAKDWVESKMD